MEKAIVVVSGGLDSTTLLYHVIDKGIDVEVITFHYGQKHSIEVGYAKGTCSKLGVKQHVLTLPTLPGSSLTEEDVEIPKDDYSVETQRITVVPNRNMVMLSIAASYAIACGVTGIYYAAHSNDQAVYPDCTEVFVEEINEALFAGNYEHVKIRAPFIQLSKADIVEVGHRLGVPFEDTWSCYDPYMIVHTPPMQGRTPTTKVGRELLHCGTCGTCRERKMAFEIAGIEDPTVYAK